MLVQNGHGELAHLAADLLPPCLRLLPGQRVNVVCVDLIVYAQPKLCAERSKNIAKSKVERRDLHTSAWV